MPVSLNKNHDLLKAARDPFLDGSDMLKAFEMTLYCDAHGNSFADGISSR
jgi:hypothetical protein